MSADARYLDAIRLHVARFWPDSAIEALAPTRGDRPHEFHEFSVLEVAPADRSGPWSYVSVGAAHLHGGDGVGHEFLIVAPRQERGMVELLRAVARYATREDHDAVLHDGHTVPIGRPWIEGSRADHLYANKPYLVSQEFELLAHDDFSIHFLWLIPISEREKEWRHSHGQEAFEQMLEDEAAIPYDPGRPSLV